MHSNSTNTPVPSAHSQSRFSAALGLGTIIFVFAVLCRRKGRQPPTLSEIVPFSNTFRYLTNVGSFLDTVSETLAYHKSNIVKFRLGFQDAYIVVGTKNTQKVFSSPDTFDGNWLQLILMDKHWAMDKTEIAKFANDKSGRLQKPAPGTGDTPVENRYWLGHDTLYSQFLSKRHYSDSLAASFYSFFSKSLDKQPLQQWATVNLFDTLKTSMAEAAIISLSGSRIIELSPDFVRAYWDFDHIAGTLVWGLPKWMRPGPVRKHERLLEMTRKHIDSAWEHFDWSGQDAESDWDPHFGSRLSRETSKWLRQGGFSNQAAAGHTLASLFGLNGNTVPVTTWALMEIFQDAKLLQDVRQEVSKSYSLDEITGERRLDAQSLTSRPLLQSLYTEIMRMHVSFVVTRQVLQDVEVDGYNIKKGSMIQCCSQFAHFEEATWATDDHKAIEFDARRHIKYVDSEDEQGNAVRKPQFTMKGRPTSFFPYGGGYFMCPGRHFAKQEILVAIALIVTKFEVEFVDWVNPNGSVSNRPAQDDKTFAGFIAMSPDRDMKIRWKRRF